MPEQPHQPVLDKLLYSRDEAAHLLSVHVNTLDAFIRNGSLRVVRKGVRVLIHRDELERFAKRDMPIAHIQVVKAASA